VFIELSPNKNIDSNVWSQALELGQRIKIAVLYKSKSKVKLSAQQAVEAYRLAHRWRLACEPYSFLLEAV
jgi:hypothetical protein